MCLHEWGSFLEIVICFTTQDFFFFSFKLSSCYYYFLARNKLFCESFTDCKEPSKKSFVIFNSRWIPMALEARAWEVAAGNRRQLKFLSDLEPSRPRWIADHRTDWKILGKSHFYLEKLISSSKENFLKDLPTKNSYINMLSHAILYFPPTLSFQNNPKANSKESEISRNLTYKANK